MSIKKNALKPKKLKKVSSPGSMATTMDKMSRDVESAKLDPSKTMEMIEDFVFHTPTGVAGRFEFQYSFTGTGSDVTLWEGQLPDQARHPGIAELETGTDANGIAKIYNGLDIPFMTMGNGVAYQLDMSVYVSTLPDGTNSYEAACGFSDNADTMSYSSAAALFYFNQAFLNWTLQSFGADGIEIDSKVPVTTGWHKLSITCSAAGDDLRWYVDGVQVGRVTDPQFIPQDIVNNPFGISAYIKKTLGTSSRQFFIDYIKVKLTFSESR